MGVFPCKQFFNILVGVFPCKQFFNILVGVFPCKHFFNILVGVFPCKQFFNIVDLLQQSYFVRAGVGSIRGGVRGQGWGKRVRWSEI